MKTSSPAVIDASLAVYTVLDTPHSEMAVRVWNRFNTADARLANAARQAGADWVHWMGEAA